VVSTNSYPDEPSCKKIAYVIDSKSRDFYPGQPICRGQIIPASAQVVIGCINVNNRFIVNDMMQLRECETDILFPPRVIERHRARSDSSDSIVMLSPSGNYLINQSHVILFWLPVKEVTKYTVEIINAGEERYKYKTKENELSILVSGSSPSYSIIVRAFSETRQLDSNIFNYSLQPQITIQLVNKYLSNIDKLTLNERTKNSLKISILREYNMLNEAMELLNTHLLKDSQDSEGYLSLGDTQLSSGLVDQAQISYNKSRVIAIINQNEVFSAIAESRLKFVKDKF
jgi:hypothetical protein